MKRYHLMTAAIAMIGAFTLSQQKAAANEMTFDELAALGTSINLCPERNDFATRVRFCEITEESFIDQESLLAFFASFEQDDFDGSALTQEEAIEVLLPPATQPVELVETPLPAGFFLFLTGITGLITLRHRRNHA